MRNKKWPPWHSCAAEGSPKVDGKYLATVQLRNPQEPEKKDLRWVMQLSYWVEEDEWVFLPDYLKVVAYMPVPEEYKGR